MGNSLSVRLREVFQSKNEESWWSRVRQNAQAFFELPRVPVLAHGAAGAFDLLDARPEPGTRKRQAVSLLVHGAVVGALLLLGQQIPHVDGPTHILNSKPLLRWKPDTRRQMNVLGGKSGAGGHSSQLPPTEGEPAPHSQVVLLHPRLPDQNEHVLLVEPTIFDANANEVRHVPELGLPNMKDRNDSAGPGRKNGIGNGDGDTMGTKDGDGDGDVDGLGTSGRGVYPLKCIYCPDPEYSDEARKAKMQGIVTLEVFVRPDGRVGRVRIVKGLGLGLDERAMDAAKGWRFDPARDAARNPIAQWVTVETTYRLF
jgi:TonB family protein